MALGSTLISQPVADLWLGSKGTIPGVRYGGSLADKPGYHNTRRRNHERWPGNYSIRLAMDLQGSALLTAGLDLTMSTTQMIERTGYLRRSASDPDDPRLRCLREFIGTLDGRRVYCRIGGNAGLGQGRGSDDWSRDSSHLWHIHLSILRAFADDWAALEGVLSVLSGESLASWLKRKGGASVPSMGSVPAPTLREDDSGPRVAELQRSLNEALSLDLAEDGDYGPNTTSGVQALQRRAGIDEDGIYGPASADALRDLMEDDMNLNDPLPLTGYARETWDLDADDLDVRKALAHGYVYDRNASDKANLIYEGQAVQTVLLQKVLAAASDLTEEEIAAAVADGVKAALPDAAALARAIGEELDGALDEAAAERAFETVLRRTILSLDVANE